MEAIARLCISHPATLEATLVGILVAIQVANLEVSPVDHRVRSKLLRAQFNGRVGIFLGHTGGVHRIARMIQVIQSGRHISGRSLAVPIEREVDLIL